MKTINLLMIITCLLLSSINIFGQKKCDKYVTYSKDEYTGEISIGTSFVKIIDPTAKHLLNAVLDNSDNAADWNVHIAFYLFTDQTYICFQHFSYESYSGVYVKDAFIKFTDETVLRFKDGIASEVYQPDAHTSCRFAYFKLNENELAYFKDKNISKVKITCLYQPREPFSEKELKEKVSLKIKNIAACFIDKLPKLEQPKLQIQENTTIQTDKKIIVENNSYSQVERSTEMPTPTYDTNTVTIYKQWKLVASLDTEGLPINSKSIILIQYFNNGTYKLTNKINASKSVTNNGEFLLLNDNKLIVSTKQDGKEINNSAAIIKLTETELVLKSQKGQYFYIVY